ncbi:MAG TPA: glycosyltransferase [Caulobacteraceae bacterium]|nr:glycosyltransferase [Caulobacteraceae bacterium]
MKTCLCFICDEGYLFPTLVAAKQAVDHSDGLIDVIIYLNKNVLDYASRRRLEELSGCQIKSIPDWIETLIDESVPDGFFKTHVNKFALYRLFLGHLVGDDYDRAIYCDGDVQIRRSLTELIDFPLEPGKVGVVPDWVAHHSADGMPRSEEYRRYLAGLGFEPKHWGQYFNSGVMVAAPATWRDIGPKALQFLAAKPEACRLHDQSALNHVCIDRTVALPIRYNFLRQYMELPAYRQIDPVIVHYVGKLKPWDGPFKPWTRKEFQCYVEMYLNLPGAGVLWKRKSWRTRFIHHLKDLVKSSEYKDRSYSRIINKIVYDRNCWDH